MNRFLKISKTFLLTVIIIFGVLLIAGTSFADDNNNNGEDDERKSVLRIAVKAPAQFPDDIYLVGSGFVIGKDEPFQYVATNMHILDPVYLSGLLSDLHGRNVNLRETDINYFIYRSRDDFVPASIFHRLEESDIAILRIDPAHLLYGFTPLPLASEDMVSIGDGVYVLGYSVNGIDELRTAYYTDVTVNRGTIINEAVFDNTRYYQIEAVMNQGNTGGPLLNEDSQVIGINTFTFRDPEEGIHGAVLIDYLVDLLDSRGIAYHQAEAVPAEDADEDEENDDPDYILIGIIAAAALGLIVTFILARPKRKKRKAPAPPPARQRSPVAAVPPSAPPQQFGSAPVTQRAPVTQQAQVPKDSPAVAETPAAVTRAKVPTLAAYLKGISGEFAGKKLEIATDPLVIGRDPNLAQLVYPQSYDTISRKHVTVRFDARTKEFIVEDSSSGGTFFSSNQRLEFGKPYRLRSGDRFYLAEEKQVFEVRLD